MVPSETPLRLLQATCLLISEWIHVKSSSIPVKGCKIEVLVGADGLSLSRKGSLSCHTCCDRGPRLFRSHLKTRRLKDRPIHLPCPTSKGCWRPMFTLCSSSFCKCNKIKFNHSWSVTGHPVTSRLCALFSIHSKLPREREDKACIKSYLSYM